MNLGELEDSLKQIVRDQNLESFYKAWINSAILKVAADFDLPALRLLDPHSFSVTTANWLFPLPENYHKALFRCLDEEGNQVKVLDRVEDLEVLDLEHEDTGDQVTHVAVMDAGGVNYLCTYPKADDTLRLWYYRRPLYLDKSDDVCDAMPAEFHEQVIIPRVVTKNYQLIFDQVENFDLKPLQYWKGEERAGLYGSATNIGLINFLIKARGGPKRTGGRDPIGARGF